VCFDFDYEGHPALRASPNHRLTRAERGRNVKVKVNSKVKDAVVLANAEINKLPDGEINKLILTY